MRRLLILCLGIWLHAADSLVTATISPAMVADVGGVALINWTITLYEIGAIVAGAAAPMLCQRMGIQRELMLAALLYGGGCLIGGVAPSMQILLAGRLAQGLGGGMMLSLCYIAVQAWFDPSMWGRLFGITAAIWATGSLLGPLIGAMFASLHAWRMTFFAFAAQTAVLAILAAFWLPARSPLMQSPPPWSVLPLLVLSAAILLIAESSVARGLALPLLGTLSGAGLLYCSARLDRRASSRLFPVKILELRHPVGAGLMMVFTLSAATTGFWAYGPLILSILFDTKPLTSGYILAGEAVAWSLATLAVTKTPARAGPALIRAGATLVALGAGGFTLMVPAGTLAGVSACALLQGLGFGMCWPSIVQRLARFSDEAEQPLAVTSPETLQRIGYAVGAATVGIAANCSGLAQGVSIAAAKTAAVWVFAAFLPVLFLALCCAWTFTRD